MTKVNGNNNVSAEYKIVNGKKVKKQEQSKNQKQVFNNKGQKTPQKPNDSAIKQEVYKKSGYQLKDTKDRNKIIQLKVNGKIRSYKTVGTLTTGGRILVQDAKGAYHVVSHTKDNKLIMLKDDYAKNKIFYESTSSEHKVKYGKKNYVITNSKRDRHGRMSAIDENGKRVVLSSDGKELKTGYVEAEDQKDNMNDYIAKQTKGKSKAEADKIRQQILSGNSSYSNKGVLRFKASNGEVWYYDTKRKTYVKYAEKEAQAIIKNLDKGATENWLLFRTGLGTDYELLKNTNAQIIDPEVLNKVNKHYSAEYGNKVDKNAQYGSGKYKTAYEAFLASEIGDDEVYQFNAALVKNNAITDQSRRNEILQTNLTKVGSRANRLAAADAASTKEDYQTLQDAAEEELKKTNYKAPFKGSDALQTYIYGVNNGDVQEIDDFNTTLIDPKEDMIDRDEIVKIKAETGALWAKKGKYDKAFEAQDGEIVDKMFALQDANGKASLNVKELKAKAKGFQGEYLMFAKPELFTEQELADKAVSMLTVALDQFDFIEKQNSLQSESVLHNLSHSRSDVVASAMSDNGTKNASKNAIEASISKAYTLIRNDKVLNLVKQKMGDKFNLLQKKEQAMFKINTFANVTTKNDNVKSNLSAEEVAQNKYVVSWLKNQLEDLERDKKLNEQKEGWKQTAVDAMRTSLRAGETRESLANKYDLIKSNMARLEAAAEGKLVDKNGKPVSFEDAMKKLGETGIKALEKANQDYQSAQATGEFVVDMAVLALPLPKGFNAANTVIKMGNAFYKVISKSDKVCKVIKITQEAIKGSKIYEVATKVATTNPKLVESTRKVATIMDSSATGAMHMAGKTVVLDASNIATSREGFTSDRISEMNQKTQSAAVFGGMGGAIGGTTAVASEFVSSAGAKYTVHGVGLVADLMGAAGLMTAESHGETNFWDNLRCVNPDGSFNFEQASMTAMMIFGHLHGMSAIKGKPMPKAEIQADGTVKGKSTPKAEIQADDTVKYTLNNRELVLSKDGIFTDSETGRKFKLATNKNGKAELVELTKKEVAARHSEVSAEESRGTSTQQIKSFKERINNAKTREELNAIRSEIKKTDLTVQERNELMAESLKVQREWGQSPERRQIVNMATEGDNVKLTKKDFERIRNELGIKQTKKGSKFVYEDNDYGFFIKEQMRNGKNVVSYYYGLNPINGDTCLIKYNIKDSKAENVEVLNTKTTPTTQKLYEEYLNNILRAVELKQTGGEQVTNKNIEKTTVSNDKKSVVENKGEGEKTAVEQQANEPVEKLAETKATEAGEVVASEVPEGAKQSVEIPKKLSDVNSFVEEYPDFVKSEADGVVTIRNKKANLTIEYDKNTGKKVVATQVDQDGLVVRNTFNEDGSIATRKSDFVYEGNRYQEFYDVNKGTKSYQQILDKNTGISTEVKPELAQKFTEGTVDEGKFTPKEEVAENTGESNTPKTIMTIEEAKKLAKQYDNVEVTEYDNGSYEIKVTDENGDSKTMLVKNENDILPLKSYDEIVEIDSEGNATVNEFNKNDLRTKYTKYDSNGNVEFSREFEYDNAGNKTKITQKDANGKITEVLDGDGNPLKFSTEETPVTNGQKPAVGENSQATGEQKQSSLILPGDELKPAKFQTEKELKASDRKPVKFQTKEELEASDRKPVKLQTKEELEASDRKPVQIKTEEEFAKEDGQSGEIDSSNTSTEEGANQPIKLDLDTKSSRGDIDAKSHYEVMADKVIVDGEEFPIPQTLEEAKNTKALRHWGGGKEYSIEYTSDFANSTNRVILKYDTESGKFIGSTERLDSKNVEKDILRNADGTIDYTHEYLKAENGQAFEVYRDSNGKPTSIYKQGYEKKKITFDKEGNASYEVTNEKNETVKKSIEEAFKDSPELKPLLKKQGIKLVEKKAEEAPAENANAADQSATGNTADEAAQIHKEEMNNVEPTSTAQVKNLEKYDIMFQSKEGKALLDKAKKDPNFGKTAEERVPSDKIVKDADGNIQSIEIDGVTYTRNEQGEYVNEKGDSQIQIEAPDQNTFIIDPKVDKRITIDKENNKILRINSDDMTIEYDSNGQPERVSSLGNTIYLSTGNSSQDFGSATVDPTGRVIRNEVSIDIEGRRYEPYFSEGSRYSDWNKDTNGQAITLELRQKTRRDLSKQIEDAQLENKGLSTTKKGRQKAYDDLRNQIEDAYNNNKISREDADNLHAELNEKAKANGLETQETPTMKAEREALAKWNEQVDALKNNLMSEIAKVDSQASHDQMVEKIGEACKNGEIDMKRANELYDALEAKANSIDGVESLAQKAERINAELKAHENKSADEASNIHNEAESGAITGDETPVTTEESTPAGEETPVGENSKTADAKPSKISMFDKLLNRNKVPKNLRDENGNLREGVKPFNDGYTETISKEGVEITKAYDSKGTLLLEASKEKATYYNAKGEVIAEEKPIPNGVQRTEFSKDYDLDVLFNSQGDAEKITIKYRKDKKGNTAKPEEFIYDKENKVYKSNDKDKDGKAVKTLDYDAKNHSWTIKDAEGKKLDSQNNMKESHIKRNIGIGAGVLAVGGVALYGVSKLTKSDDDKDVEQSAKAIAEQTAKVKAEQAANAKAETKVTLDGKEGTIAEDGTLTLDGKPYPKAEDGTYTIGDKKYKVEDGKLVEVVDTPDDNGETGGAAPDESPEVKGTVDGKEYTINSDGSATIGGHMYEKESDGYYHTEDGSIYGIGEDGKLVKIDKTQTGSDGSQAGSAGSATQTGSDSAQSGNTGNATQTGSDSAQAGNTGATSQQTGNTNTTGNNTHVTAPAQSADSSASTRTTGTTHNDTSVTTRHTNVPAEESRANSSRPSERSEESRHTGNTPVTGVTEPTQEQKQVAKTLQDEISSISTQADVKAFFAKAISAYNEGKITPMQLDVLKTQVANHVETLNEAIKIQNEQDAIQKPEFGLGEVTTPQEPQPKEKREITPVERMDLTESIRKAKNREDIAKIQQEMRKYKVFQGRKNLRRAYKAKLRAIKHQDEPQKVGKYNKKFEKRMEKIENSKVYEQDTKEILINNEFKIDKKMWDSENFYT